MDWFTPENIGAIKEAGIAIILAIVVMYWQRKDGLERIAEEKQRCQEQKEDKEILMNIVKQNTEAITKNTDVVHNSNRAIEKLMDILLGNPAIR